MEGVNNKAEGNKGEEQIKNHCQDKRKRKKIVYSTVGDKRRKDTQRKNGARKRDREEEKKTIKENTKRRKTAGCE